MYKRNIKHKLLEVAKAFPVITVTGPRQSGKTTLVQAVFPEHSYVNLEKPDIREFAEEDPNGFLKNYSGKIILDEIQQVPRLLSYIQVIVDEKQIANQFILTGSHQLALHQALAQSLAGRTAILQLLPFSIPEMKNAKFEVSLDSLLLNGFYPRIYDKQIKATDMYNYYVQTYLERDVRQLINVKDLAAFQRFMKLCAARVGQILNLTDIANNVGVSHNTIKQWLSVLEASYLIILLQPYFENFGKRVIKSPKLYFTDVGLASYLLGIENIKQVERDPLRGNLFENLIITELLKARLNQGHIPQLYYYRDSHGNEVDVIFQSGHELIPIEIKSSQTFNKRFCKGLDYFKNLVGERCAQRYVIYAGSEEFIYQSAKLINYQRTAEIVDVNNED